MYRVHPVRARDMVNSGQAEYVDSKSVKLSGGLSAFGRAGRDDGRRSTTSNALHYKNEHGYGLKPIARELKACGLVGARI